MKRWIIRQILIPWLRERALVLPADKRKDIAKQLHVDEQLIAAVEELIRNTVIEALSRE